MRVGVWDWLWAWLAAGALFKVGAHFRNLFYAAVMRSRTSEHGAPRCILACHPGSDFALAPRSLDRWALPNPNPNPNPTLNPIPIPIPKKNLLPR